jgi:aspartyl-tRNA(Asn)/glutamyl-tRNA(Gln) amidotransferase subunit A
VKEKTMTSLTRQGFRTSAAQVSAYELDSAARAPAFLTPLDLLPREPVPALADLPAPTPEPARPWPTISTAQRLMAQGELSAVELVRAALGQIDARDAELNAFVYVAPEAELLALASRLDDERQRGELRGPLHGIPVSVKDVIAVAGMPNTASSVVMADVVASEDALAVRRLREAGAILIGKAQTHEFALGVTTPQSRHPLDSARNPGGSSGGSVISVATGMSVASLGTDTRASIRVPAALCGVVCYKPTFGLVPTDGVTTLSWSLDHVAWMGQTVADAAALLGAITGRAPAPPVPGKDVRGLRVGVPVSALQGAEPEVLRVFTDALAAIRGLGVSVEEIDEPGSDEFDLAVSMGLIISRCEAAAYHRVFGALETNRERYTQPVYDQLDEAGRVLAVDYLHAQRGRAVIRERVLGSLRRFDALVTPTCLVTAPLSTEVERYFLVLSQNCILWSFIGVPAMSIPCGRTTAGLPVGIQLAAGPFQDERLLALGAAFEAAFAV